MTALIFKAHQGLSTAIDCSVLTPNMLEGKSIVQIQALRLTATHTVADAFDVSGEDAQVIVIQNASSLLHHIGHQMRQGSLTIEGDVGDFLGSQMQGGTIICKGNAGERVGDKMRRGLILVEGDVGEYCASNMAAGTIGVLGKVGARVGYGMKRGTLLLAQAPQLSATWLDCGLHSLPFLKILYKSISNFNTHFSAINTIRVQRWMGDVSGLGKAEILVLQS
jgi:formylmethanofuran dehydrogenase subunit C